MGKIHPRVFHLVRCSAALLAMSLAAWAQDEKQQQGKPMTTSPSSRDTVQAWINGFTRMDYVSRPAAMTGFTSNPTGVSSPNGSHDANSFEGELGVRFTAELNDKITGVVEVGVRRTSPAVGGVTPGAAPTVLTNFGNETAAAIAVREAAVRLPKVFTDGLSAQLGITNYVFTVRGKGGSMAFDVRRSQTIIRELDSDGVLVGRDDGFARLSEANFVEELMPVGATMRYDAGPVIIDVVLLPAAIEGGRSREDEQMYAIDAYIPLESVGHGSRVALIVSYITVPTGDDVLGTDTNSKIITMGGGTTLHVGGGLEVYVEGYSNFGRAGQTAAGERIGAGGRAGQIGAEWHYLAGNPMPFWAGLNFTMLSGDNSKSAGDRTAGKFAGYESVNDLLILEDSYYGFDWDSNMKVLKISGGTSFEVLSTKPDLDVSVILGITRAAAAVTSATADDSDRLGNEIDLRGAWHFQSQFTLKASLGFLWGSRILENAMRDGGSSHPVNHAFLFVLGFDMSF